MQIKEVKKKKNNTKSSSISNSYYNNSIKLVLIFCLYHIILPIYMDT